MANSKATKKALFMSMLSLFLCFTMLMGATFAWFTDTVTSTNNIIKSGNLDVEMYWMDGDEDPASATWTDASKGAIFNYELWEPGYVQARHLKIVNEGSLALKYQIRILANDIVSKLADVIDVYYVPEATQLSRANINNPQTPVEKLGTLSEVLNNTNTNALTAKVVGTLEANKGAASERTLTLAFKMQESAGNEYQNLAIGSDFSVQLLATQVEAEEDSFNNLYDQDAEFAPQEKPSPMVSELSGEELNVDIVGLDGTDKATLDVGYQFEPTETYAQAQGSPYRYYHADFVVSADEDIPANSLAVAGYYSLYCDNVLDGDWVALTSPDDIAKGEEVRLVEAMGGGSISVNYEELCNYGSDGTGFQCGVINLSKQNIGKTITVELRLYETKAEAKNEEVGPENYITVGTFKYTIADSTVATAEEIQSILDNATEDVVINISADITGNVTVTQKADVDVVINGNGNKFNGVMTVFGDGRQTEAETLTIKNVNFVATNGADSCIVSPDKAVNNLYSYSHNVTVENCTFTDPDGVVNCAAIRHEDGGDRNWIVKKCTVDSKMHSLLQVNNVVGKLTVDGCNVNSKNGINLNSCTNVEITSCTFDTKGYNVRFGVGSGGNLGEVKSFLIKDSTLKSACDDGDAVIMFRASAVDATLTLDNTTITGTTEISGNTEATTIIR